MTLNLPKHIKPKEEEERLPQYCHKVSVNGCKVIVKREVFSPFFHDEASPFKSPILYRTGDFVCPDALLFRLCRGIYPVKIRFSILAGFDSFFVSTCSCSNFEMNPVPLQCGHFLPSTFVEPSHVGQTQYGSTIAICRLMSSNNFFTRFFWRSKAKARRRA